MCASFCVVKTFRHGRRGRRRRDGGAVVMIKRSLVVLIVRSAKPVCALPHMFGEACAVKRVCGRACGQVPTRAEVIRHTEAQVCGNDRAAISDWPGVTPGVRSFLCCWRWNTGGDVKGKRETTRWLTQKPFWKQNRRRTECLSEFVSVVGAGSPVFDTRHVVGNIGLGR